LRFPHYLTDFRSKWESDFPTLPEVCTLEPEGNILRVKDTVDTGSQEAVSSFCVERLEADLVLRDVARWYLVRQVQPELVLPRPSYYFIALFILGSIVRYQPEVILGASSPYSQLGWLLGRLVGLAQRFYPQLMLRWLYGREIYF
ncbi:MAG: hypothetical protein Q8Q12_08505, partial [bacterium]|nr:hypothetical protein [bacterium]